MSQSRPLAVLALAVLVAILGSACSSSSTEPVAATEPSVVASSDPASTPTSVESPDESDDQSEGEPAPVEQLRLEVVAEHPHDSTAFTQGLLIEDGRMYESTGLYGESTLREVDPETGEVLRLLPIDDAFFAEGLELVGDDLIQLTWREQRAFVYDAESFDLVGSLTYETEGWGLCLDGETLVMSDGTSTLTRRDPDTFEALSAVAIELDGQPVGQLNELECVDGDVYANIWKSDFIVRIDPGSGRVTAVIDAAELNPDRLGDSDVLNGIAHDESTGRFWITGKLWPVMYEVELLPT